MKELHLYLYGEIFPDAPGGVGVFGMNWLVSNLTGSDAEEVILHINSPGGSVQEGFAMYDFLVTCGKKVTTIVEGRAASIATVVVLAGSVRKITQHSSFMIHNPWQDGWIGDAAHFRNIADKLDEAEVIIAEFYAEKTGQPLEQLQAYMKEEKEFSAEEAQALGFFTEVVETVPAKAFLLNIEEMSKPKSLMERLNSALKALKGSEIQNADFATADGSTLQIELTGEEPAQGDSVSVDGQPAADGEYKLADGKTIVVAGGKITEVKPAEVEEPADNEIAATVNALGETVTALTETVTAIKNKQQEDSAAMNKIAESLEAIGTLTASAGFKSLVKKTRLGEDGDQRTKTADEQKAEAIAAARKRAKLDREEK